MGIVSSQAGDKLISPDAVMQRLHLQPDQVPQLQRIVVAGMKVMFDPQTHQLVQQALAGPDPLPQKLGKSVAGLMGLLWQESKQSLPPQLIIPAALVLLAHAIDFLRKSGQQGADANLYAQASEVMISILLQSRGIDPQKVAQIGARAASGGSLKSAAAPQPGAAAPAAQPMQPGA